jgi:hypothetical protein
MCLFIYMLSIDMLIPNNFDVQAIEMVCMPTWRCLKNSATDYEDSL